MAEAAAKEDGGSNLAERAFEVKCLMKRLEHQVRLRVGDPYWQPPSSRTNKNGTDAAA